MNATSKSVDELKTYSAPKLVVFGRAVELTASGSTGNGENKGQADQDVRKPYALAMFY